MWRHLGRIVGKAGQLWNAKKQLAPPNRASIAIIDATNVKVIEPLFLGEPYEVIDIEWPQLNLTVDIALSVLGHLSRAKSLKVAYIAALLDQIRPAIVVTFIDNGTVFQQVSRYYKAARFLAIQNGNRLLERDNPSGSAPIFHTEFACLGRYEIDQYRKHGAQVETFYPIGSLKDSYYRAQYGQPPPSKRFDLCLVSQVRIGLTRQFTEQLDAFEMLTCHVRRFCLDHQKTVCVALRKHPDSSLREFEWERAWFREQFGELAEIFPNVKGEYTTYQLMDQSVVSIGMHSTVMREGFGRRNRILSCNFTGNPVYNFPIEGVWGLNDPAYLLFERRLQVLLDMSDADYTAACGEWPEYLIGYDCQQPTHEFLQSLIAEAVRGANVTQ